MDAKRSKSVLLTMLLTGLLPAGALQAANEPPGAWPALLPPRVENAPVVDGEVRLDPAWRRIAPTTEFTQNTPDVGQPVSQRTELRVLYTDDAVYVSFVCFEEDPARMVISDARRDASLNNTDHVLIIFDTYRDEQNGFVFGTNPAGLVYDGQLSKAGNDDSMSSGGGAGGGFNINWDGVWDVKTQIGDFGWSAEFRIPFKTLRYPGVPVQDWGANFQRTIRWRNENAYWSPIGRQFNILRLADAGELLGLEIDQQRNLKIVPYALARASDVGEQGRDNDQDWGFDIKYSITPALTLDLTYNTDFAQVEADESQVSLDRFNLFFPEKRPFFLENAGLFAVGKPRQVELFFSRRIGLTGDGEIVPIDGGARVSGGLLGANVGLMYMQTDALDGVTPANRFAVGRVNKELPNRSSVGAILVNREAQDATLPAERENQTYGVDGRWGVGEYGLVSGFLARTSTPGLEGDDQSWALSGAYDSPAWSYSADLVEVGENFNPEVGFVNRSGGYRNGSGRVLYRYRPANQSGSVLELRPHVSYSGYWDPDGFQENGFLHIDNHTEWKNGYELHTAVNFSTEGLQKPFEIYDGVVIPPGTYRNSEIHVYGQTNQAAWLSFSMSLTAGGFYSGDRLAVSPALRMRLGEKFITTLSYSQNDVDLPQGRFITRVGRLRLSYAFTPTVALEALLQYNSVDDYFSSNLRFSWLRKANTGLYIVLNDIEGFDRYTGDEPNRGLIVKYTHMFDLF